jgi:hypothetical protein
MLITVNEPFEFLLQSTRRKYAINDYINPIAYAIAGLRECILTAVANFCVSSVNTHRKLQISLPIAACHVPNYI